VPREQPYPWSYHEPPGFASGIELVGVALDRAVGQGGTELAREHVQAQTLTSFYPGVGVSKFDRCRTRVDCLPRCL